MDKVFLILILVGGFWETEANSVEGELGRDVRIQCSHSNAYSNIKYFCKNPCKDNGDILIRSNEKRKGRYSISDLGNTFYVTISHLREDDSGTYFCGIDRVGLDTFKELKLTVIKRETQDPEGDFSQSTIGEAFTTNATHPSFTTNAASPAFTTNAASSASSAFTTSGPNSVSRGKLLYIGAGLGALVLALAVVLLIFFRHRNRDIRTSSGKHQNTDYTSPSSLSGNSHSVIASSDAAGGTKTSCIPGMSSEGRMLIMFDSDNDDAAKEARSMIRLPEKNSGAHHRKQDPSASVYTEVKYSAPLRVSENIFCSRGATESGHSAASSGICSMCIPPMVSDRAGDGCLRNPTGAPAALRNATINATHRCTSTVVYYRTCGDSTGSRPLVSCV